MPTPTEWKASAVELDQWETEIIGSERFSSRIIGFWLSAMRAVTLCPSCPAILTEMEMPDFREMLSKSQATPQNYCPVCPLCLQTAFVYLEQQNDREWIWPGPREFSIYFHGWQLPGFLPKIRSLYSQDSRTYRNLLKLREEGFKGHM